MKLAAIISVAVFLAGCATQPRNKPNADYAFEQWKGCVKTEANRVDDNVSDAQTIARAVFAACIQLHEEFLEQKTIGESAAYDQTFRARANEGAPNFVVYAVLEERKRRARFE